MDYPPTTPVIKNNNHINLFEDPTKKVESTTLISELTDTEITEAAYQLDHLISVEDDLACSSNSESNVSVTSSNSTISTQSATTSHIAMDDQTNNSTIQMVDEDNNLSWDDLIVKYNS